MIIPPVDPDALTDGELDNEGSEVVSSFEEFAVRQNRAAEEALGEFLSVLAPEDRLKILNVGCLKLWQRHALLEARGDALKRAIEGLSPEKRRKVFGDCGRGSGDVGIDGDVAEGSAASYVVDLSEDIDDLADELREQFRFDQRTAAGVALFVDEAVREQSGRYSDWLLAKVIIYLTSVENCKIAAVALAFALSVPRVWVNGELHATQLSAAKALGTSRQNLSKAVRSAGEFLGIDQGMHLKPPASVAEFKTAQVGGKHWRNQAYAK